MCLSAVLGVGSALIGASSAKSAQRSQERAAQKQLDVQKQMYDETTERFQPFYNSGLNYQNALNYELLGGERPMMGGTAPQITESTTPGKTTWQTVGAGRGEHHRPVTTPGTTSYSVGGQSFDTRDAAEAYAKANTTGGVEYQGFKATPGYQFALEQGQNAIDNSAASRGGLFSGATLKAQQKYGTGLANQEYGNYLNRLTGQAAAGQAAAGNMANAGANYAQGASTAYGNMGNAGAAGAIGVGNALMGGIQNGIGLWNYQNQQTAGTGQQQAGIFDKPWGAKGFWG